jgi:arylsulfatase A-like enzyme
MIQNWLENIASKTLVGGIQFVVLFICFTGCSPTKSPKEEPLPNVVFIFADDMGYGEIQALNPERSKIPTPHLNQLVMEGMAFTDAHTSSSVCTPSRYSLLTGRYNWRTKLQSGVVQGGGDPLIAADRMTLASLLRNQGYSTSIVGKWHLEYHYDVPDGFKEMPLIKKEGYRVAHVPVGTKIPDGPITRGFDTFYGFHHSASMSSIVRNDEIVKEMDVIDVLPSLTDEVVNLINQKAEDAKSGKPFFIYFPMNSPHTPIVPSKSWQGKTGLGDYGDFVAQTDDAVGKVLQALNEQGLAENTMVIFSTDNGTSRAANIKYLQSVGHFSSANLRGSKSDIWDGGHRVPFILKWPKQVKAASTNKQLICLSDMMATLAEYFAVDLPDNVAEDSYSFLPSLWNEPIENPRTAIVHHSINGRFSIRKGDWKLLLAPGSGGWSSPKDPEATTNGLPELQLYNMSVDVGEQDNLIQQNPERAEELTMLLEEMVSRGRSTPGINQSNDAAIDIRKAASNYLK